MMDTHINVSHDELEDKRKGSSLVFIMLGDDQSEPGCR